MIKTIAVANQKGEVGKYPFLFEEVVHSNSPRPKQLVSFEELLMSQVVSQDALIRLLIAKGIITKVEFLEMLKAVEKERKKRCASIQDRT